MSPSRPFLLLAVLAVAALTAAETWTASTIGTPYGTGSHSIAASGAITMNAPGGYIWDGADSTYWLQQAITGDVTITARVVSLQKKNIWSKAGLMIRSSNARGSAHVLAWQSPERGRYVQHRSVDDGSCQSGALQSGNAPGWLRLRRVGNVFTASASSDGTTWTSAGSLTIAMPATVLVGLVASPNTRTAGQAVFDQISIVRSTNQAPVVTLAATATVTSQTATLAATISDNGGAPGIAWSVVTGSSVAPVRFANRAVEDPVVTFPRNGSYVLQVVATDAQGASTTRSITVTVNAPGSFSIQGNVKDGGNAPSPGVATRLLWSPAADAEVGRSTTASSTGAFSHGGLLGSPLDFEVVVPGSP